MAQDFGDDGELYQSQLHRLARFILEHPGENEPGGISELQPNHNISAILAEIESEAESELVLQRTNETGLGRGLAALDAPHISHDCSEHAEATAGSMADTEPTSQDVDAEGLERAAPCDGEAAAGYMADAAQAEGAKRRRTINTAVPSSQPNTEEVTSTRETGTGTLNSWFKSMTIVCCLFVVALYYQMQS